MLKILKGQEDIFQGIVVCEESGNASSLPLLLHFLSSATSTNMKVFLVTSKLTETNYKLICSKAGVRWNASQILFHELIPSFSSFDIEAKKLMKDIQNTVQESQPFAVIFDDLSVLEQLGASPVEIAIFLHQLYSSLSEENATIFASFSSSQSLRELLQHRCHVFAQFVPVGHGFGKDASSKAILTIKSVGGATSKKALLLSGERAITGTWVLAG